MNEANTAWILVSTALVLWVVTLEHMVRVAIICKDII